MPKIYTLYPGKVTSQSDGDRHYVGEFQLAMLYGVRIVDCMVVRSHYYDKPYLREYVAEAEKLIPLRPRYDGKYTLQSTAKSAED